MFGFPCKHYISHNSIIKARSPLLPTAFVMSSCLNSEHINLKPPSLAFFLDVLSLAVVFLVIT